MAKTIYLRRPRATRVDAFRDRELASIDDAVAVAISAPCHEGRWRPFGMSNTFATAEEALRAVLSDRWTDVEFVEVT